MQLFIPFGNVLAVRHSHTSAGIVMQRNQTLERFVFAQCWVFSLPLRCGRGYRHFRRCNVHMRSTRAANHSFSSEPNMFSNALFVRSAISLGLAQSGRIVCTPTSPISIGRIAIAVAVRLSASRSFSAGTQATMPTLKRTPHYTSLYALCHSNKQGIASFVRNKRTRSLKACTGSKKHDTTSV